MSISSELKIRRENRGLSMTKIAQELGIPKGTYASYEYGTREPNIEMMNKIANFYGASVDQLLGRCPLDPIAALCDAYGFGITERAIITAYCAMTEKQRNSFMDQIKLFNERVSDACKKVAQEQTDETIQPDTVNKDECDSDLTKDASEFASEKLYQVDKAARSVKRGKSSPITTEYLTKEQIADTINAEDADPNM